MPAKKLYDMKQNMTAPWNTWLEIKVCYITYGPKWVKRKSSECHPSSTKPKKFGTQASGKICTNIIPASLVDSVSNLIKKYNSWCMSGYAHSQKNFLIRNTGISKVLGLHNTMWTMLKNNRAVPSMSPQNQLVKNLQVSFDSPLRLNSCA